MTDLFILPTNGFGIKTLSTPESTRLNANVSKFSVPKPCLTCNDQGEFLWWNRYGGDGTEVVTYQCDCINQWILYRYLASHGIGLAYQRIGSADMTGVEPGGSALIMEWFQNRDAYIHRGLGLVLHGEGGTGKTSSAIMILKRVLSDGGDGFFVTFSDLLRLQSNGFKDKAEQDWFLKRIRSAGLLVIDDLGKESKTRTMEGGKLRETTTSYAEGSIDSILRSRVQSQLSTIITTNVDLSSAATGYSQSTFDLLLESSLSHKFVGESYRTQILNRVREESQMNLIRPVVIS